MGGQQKAIAIPGGWGGRSLFLKVKIKTPQA
jgi:hypothetical protein